MAYTIVMQEWVRFNGLAATNVVVQDEEHWLDIGGFQAVRPMIQVSHFGGSPVVTLETSPTRDDSLFKSMYDVNSTQSSAFSVSGAGLVYGPEFGWENTSGLGAPPGKWLRWKVTGGANWSLTFRITLNAAQGRGGSFRHASIPLPEMGRRTAEDHSHKAQGILRARAAQMAALKAGTGVGPDPIPLDHVADLDLDDDQLEQATSELLSALGRPTTGADRIRMRSALESTLNAAILDSLHSGSAKPRNLEKVERAKSGSSKPSTCEDCVAKAGDSQCACQPTALAEMESGCGCKHDADDADSPNPLRTQNSPSDRDAPAVIIEPVPGANFTSLKRSPRSGSAARPIPPSAAPEMAVRSAWSEPPHDADILEVEHRRGLANPATRRPLIGRSPSAGLPTSIVSGRPFLTRTEPPPDPDRVMNASGRHAGQVMERHWLLRVNAEPDQSPRRWALYRIPATMIGLEPNLHPATFPKGPSSPGSVHPISGGSQSCAPYRKEYDDYVDCMNDARDEQWYKICKQQAEANCKQIDDSPQCRNYTCPPYHNDNVCPPSDPDQACCLLCFNCDESRDNCNKLLAEEEEACEAYYGGWKEYVMCVQLGGPIGPSLPGSSPSIPGNSPQPDSDPCGGDIFCRLTDGEYCRIICYATKSDELAYENCIKKADNVAWDEDSRLTLLLGFGATQPRRQGIDPR